MTADQKIFKASDPQVEENLTFLGKLAGGLALHANPDLSESVDEQIKKDTVELAKEELQKLRIGGKESSGALTVLFKDAADKNYGAMAIAFDSKGHYTQIASAKPGTPEAEQLVALMKKENSQVESSLKRGDSIVSLTGSLPPPKP